MGMLAPSRILNHSRHETHPLRTTRRRAPRPARQRGRAARPVHVAA